MEGPQFKVRYDISPSYWCLGLAVLYLLCPCPLRYIFFAGYTLNVKRDKDDWNSIELSSEYSVYTLENLICGSLYHVYILAFNRVGQGSPSPIQTISTKGGQPLLPKEKEFILTNSTTLQLNLDAWPDGGCPIMQFSIQYKAHNENKWTIIAKSVSEEKIVVHNLMPATWYQLKVTAENGAGTAHGLFNFATRTASGGEFQNY